jgi:RNA polymerase sigma-70 factor (ECF subfamily)
VGTMTSTPWRLEQETRFLARARSGDVEAFVALIHLYDPGIRALAYRLLGDRTRMDDVLQDTYLRAFRAIQGFAAGSSFGTWLYRIAYNACLDELRRKRSRGQLVPLDEVHDWPGTAPDSGDVAADRADLAAALAALPVDLRAVVLLVDAEGMDYRTAGEVIGIPPGTVGTRLMRARAQLRRSPALDRSDERTTQEGG